MEKEYDFIAIGDTVTDAFIRISQASIMHTEDAQGNVDEELCFVNGAKIPYDYETTARTWPFGLALHAADFWKERRYLSKLAEKSRDFQFKANQVRDRDLPQTIIVVLGESSRYDRCDHVIKAD